MTRRKHVDTGEGKTICGVLVEQVDCFPHGVFDRREACLRCTKKYVPLRKKQMKLTDLKLLADVMFDGSVDGIDVGEGFVLAKERLTRAGLIEENPQIENRVRMTDAGLRFVDLLLERELR